MLTSSSDNGADDLLGSVADTVTALADMLSTITDVDATVERICSDAVDSIDDAEAAAVTVVRDGMPATICSTSDAVIAVDDAQYETGEGPCLDAIATQSLVVSNGTTPADRWPAFTRRAAGSGYQSFLSAPLAIDADYSGALNLYSRQLDAFSTVDAAAMRIYVSVAVTALGAARRAAAAQAQVARLLGAMQSRASIEQVKGIVMVMLNVTDEKAFDLIKWRSQETNTAVRVLCRQLLADVAANPLMDQSVSAEFAKLLMTAHERVGGDEV
ncbi:GAF and ANTAR domain-containing protein [Rhodococcoides corynebacterioides]|uniref:GAF and ANTAR domain-containing protein n=1 Tax=Rhodococcoides corynebacterioides TaxID=53972 RepID=UPI001C9B5CBA|nr:GAF and ANTAR domain-containing protein [Rhodococcus corynebacterioides]MBY6361527.1 GAF and ANTAR domain-containing protein [Rhodococcus corynebacterioides]